MLATRSMRQWRSAVRGLHAWVTGRSGATRSGPTLSWAVRVERLQARGFDLILTPTLTRIQQPNLHSQFSIHYGQHSLLATSKITGKSPFLII